MKAIVQERFGPPDVLQLVATDRPVAGADEVLVRVHAAALVSDHVIEQGCCSRN